MKLDIAPGTYVVAVSGGIDSMVLLQMLAKQSELQLIVAHFDHGIRPDSFKDRQFVEAETKRYGLPFVSETVALGPNASEEKARELRYAFLRYAKEQARARAIIMAHHQDDIIETMILNLRRGTGRKGLSSLKTTNDLIRPLLTYTKNELQMYAEREGVQWREDSTNKNENYARNYIRRKIVSQLSPAQRAKLVQIYEQSMRQNEAIDELVQEVTANLSKDNVVVRKKFIALPHAVAHEVMAHLLRQRNVRNLSRQGVSRLVVALKTGQPHTTYDVDKNWIFLLSNRDAKIIPRYRS
ncbi:MAG TPA: tRNA lysidine(34) synthetase TilS [Candidatus Saccharimonadales bacterium]|nr:tRNA lysidine(34) synthetase TilS [Candidatus Saccharimonadales bacterium]